MKICIEITPEQEATIRRYLTEICETDGNVEREAQDMIRRAVSVYADALPAKPAPDPIWREVRDKTTELYHDAYCHLKEMIEEHGPVTGKFEIIRLDGTQINVVRVEVDSSENLNILRPDGYNIMEDQSELDNIGFASFCESIDIHIKSQKQ